MLRVFRTSELSLMEISRRLIPRAADQATMQAIVDEIIARVRAEEITAILGGNAAKLLGM